MKVFPGGCAPQESSCRRCACMQISTKSTMEASCWLRAQTILGLWFRLVQVACTHKLKYAQRTQRARFMLTSQPVLSRCVQVCARACLHESVCAFFKVACSQGQIKDERRDTRGIPLRSNTGCYRPSSVLREFHQSDTFMRKLVSFWVIFATAVPI
jgi:hypothetical protein